MGHSETSLVRDVWKMGNVYTYMYLVVANGDGHFLGSSEGVT